MEPYLNYPLIYPKYPQLRAIRTQLKGPWGSWYGRNPKTVGSKTR